MLRQDHISVSRTESSASYAYLLNKCCNVVGQALHLPSCRGEWKLKGTWYLSCLEYFCRALFNFPGTSLSLSKPQCDANPILAWGSLSVDLYRMPTSVFKSRNRLWLLHRFEKWNWHFNLIRLRTCVFLYHLQRLTGLRKLLALSERIFLSLTWSLMVFQSRVAPLLYSVRNVILCMSILFCSIA